MSDTAAEFRDDDGTVFRFGSDDSVSAVDRDGAERAYRWTRGDHLAIRPKQVQYGDQIFGRIDHKTRIIGRSGDAPPVVTKGCWLVWYSDDDVFSDADLAVIRAPDGDVIAGLVGERSAESLAEAEARTREDTRHLGRIYLGVVALTVLLALAIWQFDL